MMAAAAIAATITGCTDYDIQQDYNPLIDKPQTEEPAPEQPVKEKENVVGAYAQYTFNLHERLVAMAGVRVDHSSEYGTFVTPRFHVKWQVNDILGLRASVGKGYRTVHALAENNYLLASGRELT